MFGAVGRGHICAPGPTLDELLDSTLPMARPIVERIVGHLERLDDGDVLIVDPVDTAVLLKAGPTFAVLRPMRRWVAVGFSLRRRLTSPRLSRKVVDHGSRAHHVINVDDPAQIDDELLAWLAEAFLGEECVGSAIDDESGAAMVPDDVDEDIA